MRRLQRQVNLYRRSVLLEVIAALQLDPAAMSFDKLLRDEESDAGPDGAATGEEGVEDLGEILSWDADARVTNGNENAAFFAASVFGRNKQRASRGHRVHRVCDEV